MKRYLPLVLSFMIITTIVVLGLLAAQPVINRPSTQSDDSVAVAIAIASVMMPTEDNPIIDLPIPNDLPVPNEEDTGLTLVMVMSQQCLPCQAMKPILNRVGGQWKVKYVDYDDPGTKQWLEVYSIESVPYYVTYRGHEALEVAQGEMSFEEVLGWLSRVAQNVPAEPGSRFVKSWAQDSLKKVDRTYLQKRMAPGSCGMLGCLAHGGGWIQELVTEVPDSQKPKGHWETVPGPCPTCPSTRVWVADPDATGTVPWPSQGNGVFGRRRN